MSIDMSLTCQLTSRSWVATGVKKHPIPNETPCDYGSRGIFVFRFFLVMINRLGITFNE